MALRISEISESAGRVLKVDGRLSGREAEELARVGAACSRPVILDLAGLIFADDEGVGVLRDLRAHGAGLRNVPRYIELVLELDGSRSTVAPGSGTSGE